MAEYLQVSCNTVYKMVRLGRIPAVHVGRLLRISLPKFGNALCGADR
ncbi:helix-turn-helix domain-containing protein [Atopobium sp. oral taxon 810]